MSNLAKYRAGSGDDSDWIERELAAAKLPDARLEKRLQQLVAQLSAGLGRSIPFACQDWAETKAAYRFFSNERIREEQILAGHFEATRERLPDGDGPVLVLHDTTEFTYQRQDVDAVGMVSKGSVRKDEQGRPVYFTTCGVCLHSSLAVTLEGLPLGLTAARFWSRKAFKGRQARRKAHNAPIEEKESMRWLENLRASSGLLGQPGRIVHVADQESDIFDLFCVARQLETHFLVRTRADRLADGGPASVAEAVAQSPCRGLYRIEVRNRKSEPSPALLEIRYRRLRIKTPKGKQKRYPEQTVTAIEAREQETPPDRERIDWKLVTDLPVGSVDEAIEKLQWYALRWKIEIFHKILKSGCRAEQSRLRTASRLTNLLAVLCILAWRVFWLTTINRVAPQAGPELVFTQLEMRLLDRLVDDKPAGQPPAPVLSRYLIKLARLGGYLARGSDPPPGNETIWRGLTRLIDIQLGVTLGATLVGN
jgi:Transposase DNA-binding/Transposase Tn5 dimerisation domain